MLSERSLNIDNEFHATFRKIEKNDKFKDLLEYGFFLRNSQIVLPFGKSLSYLQRSIDFFERHNETRYAAYSRLTYSIQCARLGYLHESSEILDKIAPLLLHTSFEKHIVYLNQASIRLLRGIADEKTDHLLDKAFITATTVFDRVVILNNMLCSLIIKGKHSEEFGSLMEKLVTESKDEPDLQLRKKSYTNIYLYYCMIGDEKCATYWKNAAQSINLKSEKQTIENVFLFDEEPSKDMSFLASLPCCICFITYWHFDIPLLGF